MPKNFSFRGAAPQFPPVKHPAHTLITEEDKAEGYSDVLRTTVLGETFNDSEMSPDSMFIFDPNCKEIKPDQFHFTDVLPGEYGFFGEENTDPRTAEVITIWSSSTLLDELTAAGSPFQFVAAPGTEREQRYRVARGGKLQKLGLGTSWSPFTLAKPDLRDPLVITVKSEGHTVVNWTINGKLTGKRSKAKYANLSRHQLTELADIFYALNDLNSETFALYGQMCGICGVCGRTLTDATSIKRGVGPNCWKRLQGVLPGAKPQQHQLSTCSGVSENA